MITEARAQVAAAAEQYREAYDAALGAGWSPAALADMGYTAPSARKRSRAPSANGDTTAAAGGDDPDHGALVA